MKYLFKYIFIFICFKIINGSVIGGRTTTTSPTATTKKSSDHDDYEYTPASNTVKNKSQLLKKCDPCPDGVKCVPTIQCPAHIYMKPNKQPQICDLPAGTHGYCCHTGQNHTANNHKNSKNIPKSSRSASNADDNIMNAIISQAEAQFAQILHDEKKHFVGVVRGQPQFTHTLLFHESPQDLRKSIDLSHRAMEQVFASRVYKSKENISATDFQLKNIAPDLVGTPLQRTCGKRIQCSNHESRYRSQDGKCNNPDPAKSLWGSTGHPAERILPPSYDDGIWEHRSYSTIDGSHLPNPRTISRTLFNDVDRPHPKYNLLFMQFGQFITHDVTRSSSITTSDGKDISCCTEDGSAPLPPNQRHYSCLPIEIEPHDEFYEHFKQGCMNFVRSALAPDAGCTLGYGKQLSKVTHFLDGSGIYGSTLQGQAELRSFKHGRLRMSNEHGRDLLPLTTDKESCDTSDNGPCFLAGDNRANQIISLTALHVLFAREHNRLTEVLSHLNPHWDDDKLFYEAREIVISKLQLIVYTEWLPHVIGSHSMERFALHCQQYGYSSDYDSNVNPCVTSEFSTAAFRFGHTVVDGKFRIHKGSHLDEIINIPDVMFNPVRLRRREFLDDIFITMTHQPMQEFDSAVTKGLSNFLFRGHSPFGLDLISLNIQRGRDHGLRSYNDYLEVTGHHRVKDFNEFGYDAAMKLQKVYHHPDDIDLWVGCLLESATGDALVGPTFSEIIADQFSRFRKGDRYFHEHNPDINPGHFSESKLQEIRKSTMARIICDNVDGYSLHAVSPHAFLQPDVPGNSPAPCDNGHAIPQLNYALWKE